MRPRNLIGAIVGVLLAIPAQAAADTTTTTTTQPACGTGTQLAKLLTSATPGQTVTLGKCYTTNGTVKVTGVVGVNVVGSSTVLSQIGQGDKQTTRPILDLEQSEFDTFTNITNNGPSDGTKDGAAYEGDSGVLLRDDHNITFTNVGVSNVQGDFLDLYPVQPGGDNAINTNIVWTDSQFNHAGYHGVTLEAIDQASFTRDWFQNVGVDAVDSEVDLNSTSFKNGQPQYAAEDHVSFDLDHFNHFGADLFASIQGQTPGVQEQDISFTSNWINSPSPLFQIVGTSNTDPRYQFNGFTFRGNVDLNSARPVQGGSAGEIASVKNVQGFLWWNNSIPVFYGNKPGTAVILTNGVTGALAANRFPGASTVVANQNHGNLAVCANVYGINKVDSVCP